MKIFTVRLDDELHEDLSRMAQAQGTTLSELARRALEATARPERSGSVPRGSGASPVTLTTLERAQLALLHRILARLVDGRGEDGDFDHQMGLAQALERGYTTDYEDVFHSIEPELSRQESDLVMDVLDMFAQLEWSYDQLGSAEREELGDRAAHAVRFGGFDLNHRREARLLRYARHLIATGRWESLGAHFDDKHERGNSHHPRLATYARMLEEFGPIWRARVRSGGGTLTAEEIARVVNVGIHPDNR